MPKRRVVIYLDEPQHLELQRLKSKHGASVAELCRRAIAEYLKHNRHK
jgi:Ribbon-helix-helix protein, copG family